MIGSRAGLVAAAAALALTAACSGGSSGGSATTAGTPSGAGAGSLTPSGPAAGASAARAGARPFGAGCANVPTAGPGSFAAMGTAPVATAAGSIPDLTSLTKAVAAASLTDSLNGQQNVTVFAPVNAAFAALPADQTNALLADVPRLTSVLTHHVVQGRLGPDRLAGEHIALDNGTVTVAGSGEKFTIAADQTLSGKPATVVCGNVQTANATVYFVDQLLKPRTG
jgi:uncharacterized surface protein with fasciclin (FAS1) repeats